MLRKRREIFQRWLEELPSRELVVLDIGGRLQPYRPLLTGRIRRYIAVDLRRTPLVDVIARGEQLPFPGDTFDLVICTQVLQYVPEPELLAQEIRRVLKPGGSLLLSVPSAWPSDSAEDCWRFLPAGLRHLLGAFDQVQIEAEGGTVAGFFRLLNVWLSMVARYPFLRTIFGYSIFPLVNVAGSALQGLTSSRNEQFAVNYSVCARK